MVRAALPPSSLPLRLFYNYPYPTRAHAADACPAHRYAPTPALLTPPHRRAATPRTPPPVGLSIASYTLVRHYFVGQLFVKTFKDTFSTARVWVVPRFLQDWITILPLTYLHSAFYCLWLMTWTVRLCPLFCPTTVLFTTQRRTAGYSRTPRRRDYRDDVLRYPRLF